MTVGCLRLIYGAFIKIHIIMQPPSKAMSSAWGRKGGGEVIENCCSPSSQMIAKQSYEKRKSPFLINMWEVRFPPVRRAS